MKTLKPARFSNIKLLVFWLFVFVFPVVTAKVLINTHEAQQLRSNETGRQAELRYEMDQFIADLDLGYQIEKQIKSAERILSGKLAGSSVNPQTVCRLVRESFAETGIFMPVLIAAYLPENGKTEVLLSDPGYVNPGRKSLEIIMSYINDKTHGRIDESRDRMYKLVCRAAFGDYLQPGEQEGLLTSGFMSRGKGDRTFIYHNHVAANSEKKQRILLLTVFAESRTGVRELLQLALKAGKNSSTARSYALLQTAVSRDFFYDRHNRMYYAVPVPPTALRTGSHQRKDWYSSAINSQQALHKPGRLPYAVVSHIPQLNHHDRVSVRDLANLLLLAIFFTGTALVRQIVTDRFARAPVNRKFAMCILLSTALPFAIMVVATYRYFAHFSQTTIQNHLSNMSNDLYLMESNIHNHEQREKFKRASFINRLKASSHLEAAELRQILDQELGRLFMGYIMFRNDATLVERLPETGEVSEDDRGKLMLWRDLTLAQAYDVFVNAGVLGRDFDRRILQVPDFKRWRAFSVHYLDIDRSSFCSQDGEYFPAKISERQYVELSTHNLFREGSPNPVWAILALLTDSRASCERYLNELPGNTFISLSDDMVTHTAIYCLNSLSQIDRQLSWPMSALADDQMLQAVANLTAGKTETAWYSFDQSGAARLFCARAVSDTPFIIASHSTLHSPAIIKAFLPILLLITVLYLLALIKLLSMVLAESFISPVNMMMQGLSALDHGCYPAIVCHSSNELGSLIDDFNGMVLGMRQRRILERFISDEVSQSVASVESNDDQAAGTLVHRAIMFIHIRSFEKICESLEPEAVITLLNLYFSTLEPAIMSCGGQIDKYIGDAIMVSFSAERCNGRPEYAAAMTALLCRRKLPELGHRLAGCNLPHIVIGTGIAAGPVILGKIGAKNGRKDFTLIGDAVNLAARLESASHHDTNPHILVSEIIKEAAAPLHFISSGRLEIKGKKVAVEVFELEDQGI